MNKQKENEPIPDENEFEAKTNPDWIDLPTSGIVEQGTCIFMNVVDTSVLKPNPDTLHGLAGRFNKYMKASEDTSALDNLSTIYKDAVAVSRGGASANVRGFGLLATLIVTVFATVTSPHWVPFILGEFISFHWHGTTMSIIAILAIIWLIPKFWVYMRMDLFGMDDTPIIFDRKRQRVYRLVPLLDGSTERSWKAIFGPVHLQALEYHWKDITVEHWIQISGTQHSVIRNHYLLMTVRGPLKLAESQMQRAEQKGLDVKNTIIDQFMVGSLGVVPESIRMWWEYLRRYMEGKGPALPNGEQLQIVPRPRSLWQSIGAVGPFGPRFMWWWRNSRFVLVIFLVMFPFSLPFNIAWGICNRISYLTMRKVVWPQELLDRLGEPLQKVD